MSFLQFSDKKIHQFAQNILSYDNWIEGYSAESDALMHTAIETSKMFTLKNLYDRISVLPEHLVLKYEDDGYTSSHLHSYRGYYKYPALGYSSSPPDITELKNNIQKVAEGKVDLQGYKGGYFTMSWDSPVWASPYSDCSGTGIFGISDYGIVETLDIEVYLEEIHSKFVSFLPESF